MPEENGSAENTSQVITAYDDEVHISSEELGLTFFTEKDIGWPSADFTEETLIN